VLVLGDLATVASNPDEWIQAYFHGPRARAAVAAQARQQTPQPMLPAPRS